MRWSNLFTGFCFSLFFCPVQAQVNPQNGAAQFSLPLYSFSDAGNRLQLNASLDYLDGNGLRVSELASEVGTGWALSCGGMIQRIQHGEPDDQRMDNPPAWAASPNVLYTINYYPDGYLYNSTDPTPYNPTDVVDNGGAYSMYTPTFVPIGVLGYKPPPQYLADRDQDVFAFSFNGRSGEFVIGKNGKPVTLVDSKLQISFQTADMTSSNIRTTINQFTITDESGIQYVFKDLELSYVCTYSDLRNVVANGVNIDNVGSNPVSEISKLTNTGYAMNVILGIPNNWFVVDKWYLSEIINPFTGKQITFNYSTYEEDFNTDKSVSAIYTSSSGSLTNATIYWNRYKVRAKRLSSVTLSDAERLDFVYSTSPRIDLPHQNALTQLKVSYNGNPVYNWQFGFGYMVGVDGAIKSPTYSYTSTEQDWSRLCLLSAQKCGLNGINEPPYQFAYNLGDNTTSNVVPPMCTIFTDKYGYYNASTTSNEGFENSFYSIAIVNNLVRNFFGSAKSIASGKAQYGILQSVTYPYSGTLSYAYEQNQAAIGVIGGVRVNQTTQYDGISHTNDIIKKYAYVNSDETTTSGWGGENPTYTMSGTVTAYGCSSSQSPFAIIKEVASSYIEQAFLLHTITIASAEAVAAELSDLLGQFEIAFLVAVLFEGQQTPPTQTINYTTYQLQSFSDNNPLPWGYARTEVQTLNGSGNAGKVVYTFSNTNDRAIDVPTLSVPYSNRPRYAPWVYGVPESITYYDNSGTNIVKQTVNHYTFIVNTLNDNNFLSKSWSAIGAEYGCNETAGDPATTLISQETYYPFTGHAVLTSTDETVYNASQQTTTVTTNFEYDANYQLKHKYVNNSKGEKVETFYYHPYDYSQASGGIAIMNQTTSNILAPVVSAETYINKSDGNQYMTSAMATDYKQGPNGDIKPSVLYRFQNPLPVVSTTIQPFNTASVVRDPNYYKQVEAYAFDNFGNAVQTISGGNRIGSGIYDYGGQLQVAVASNASFNDIWYTSFEADGGKPGSKVNTVAIVSSDARTGNQCFNLSDNSNASNGYFSFAGLNNSLNYIVSFWSKNGSACLSGTQNGTTVFNSCQGTSGWKQGETANGWTYFEVQVNNVDKISASGTGLIDEFRIYPVGAQMKTTTYSPLIGKTSECGVDGKVVYYQYDEMGRLRYILDDQKNIIRSYDYNYKQ